MPDGRALFVPLTAPGDRVLVRITQSKKRFARAALVDVLEPSPDRVEPACSFFGACGGCAWQHIDYAAQVEAKTRILREALVRIGHLEIDGPIPIAPSPEAYGYRNRARLLQAGESVGYRARKSHRICAVDACPVLEPSLERSLTKLTTRTGRSTRDVEWEIVSGREGRTRAARVGTDDAGSAETVTMSVGTDRLRISHGVFAQGNALLLDALADAVAREAGRGTSVVELFAGAGLLTLELSRRFDCVWALESNPRAIDDLRFNLRAANRTNVDVRPGRVERTLRSLSVSSPDTLVLDPPRTGVPSDAFEAFVAIRPEKIVYLSCDPATLARDIAQLRTHGYRLGHVEAFDLFPQTPHVESLATLTLPESD